MRVSTWSVQIRQSLSSDSIISALKMMGLKEELITVMKTEKASVAENSGSLQNLNSGQKSVHGNWNKGSIEVKKGLHNA